MVFDFLIECLQNEQVKVASPTEKKNPWSNFILKEAYDSYDAPEKRKGKFTFDWL